jgi:Asp-tRNA(Asn)/Glu-tRNA(Gln) amidotransferase A subunit family amidase
VLFGSNDFVLMPATPVAKLDALADHSAARPRILRCTMPASLAGLPVVVLPARAGSMQLMGQAR